MLSKDNVSGVSDEDVLLRWAVFLIFRFAACTMFATKRDELSLCKSLLNAAKKESKIFVNGHQTVCFCSYVRFWQHFPIRSQLREALSRIHWKLENSCSSISAAGRSQRSIHTVEIKWIKWECGHVIDMTLALLTLLISDSTIWHWCRMSFTTISKESFDFLTIEGPNTIAVMEQVVTSFH